MICPNCSNEVSDDAVFCSKCGATLRTNPTDSSQNVSQDEHSMTSNESVPQRPSKKFFVISLISLLLSLICTLGVAYLAFSCYQQSVTEDTYELNQQTQLLIVEINADLTNDQISDSTQIKNALKNGGQIRLNMDSLDSSIDSAIGNYGASDAEGNYWVFGALMNYISNQGWELVQAPSSGLSDEYYFVRQTVEVKEKMI